MINLICFHVIDFYIFNVCLGHNGKYWHVDSEGVNVDSDTPEGFFLELREPTRICIKSAGPAGYYLSAGKNGAFRYADSDYSTATKWEY